MKLPDRISDTCPLLVADDGVRQRQLLEWHGACLSWNHSGTESRPQAERDAGVPEAKHLAGADLKQRRQGRGALLLVILLLAASPYVCEPSETVGL